MKIVQSVWSGQNLFSAHTRHHVDLGGRESRLLPAFFWSLPGLSSLAASLLASDPASLLSVVAANLGNLA